MRPCLSLLRRRRRLAGLRATAVESLGGVDLVAAVAGRGAISCFATALPATLTETMEVNFTAPAELVRHALPLLRQGRDPAIVLVGSILGYHPLPWHGEYGAAKAALRSLATTVAAIVLGLERRRGEMIPGWQAKGYVTLARLAPGLLRRSASHRANRAEEAEQ